MRPMIINHIYIYIKAHGEDMISTCKQEVVKRLSNVSRGEQFPMAWKDNCEPRRAPTGTGVGPLKS